MLRPVPMRQLSIIVPKEQLHNLLLYAGQEKILHLTSVPHKGLPDGVERYEASNILARSTTIRNRILSLAAPLSSTEASTENIEAPIQDLELLASFLEGETASLEEVVRQTEESLAKIRAEQDRTEELVRFLAGLENAGVSLDAIGGKGFLTILAGEIGQESVEELHRELREVTYENVIFAVTGSSGKTQTFLAAFPTPFGEEAEQTVTGIGAKLEPPWKDLPTDTGEAKKLVDARLEIIKQSSMQIEHDRRVRAKELSPRAKGLSILSDVLEIRARALSGSSTTVATAMLQTWVPEDMTQRFVEGANRACDGLVSVHLEEATGRGKSHSSREHSDAHSEVQNGSGPPTLVRVPRWAQPLQSIVNNFGIPSYNEINPLPFMIVSYPLIYGLMFGDFGQGPLFILFGLLFLRLKRSGKKIPFGDIGQLVVGSAELMILLGIGITIFGFVFGDFFGFESKSLFGFPGIFSPTEGALHGDISHLQTFMIITLFFGVAHYTMGLGLSAYTKISRREYSEALFGPLCWVSFYLAFVYLVARFVLADYKFSALLQGPLPLVLLPIALFFIPFGLLVWKEGGMHALEAFTSIGSNTFSYLRIWALNIADFFVKFAFFAAGGILGGELGGIVGAVLGNLLVMILEGLIVFVQTLRLHWVEWFSKFYEGTGLSFAPYQEPKGWIVPTSG